MGTFDAGLLKGRGDIPDQQLIFHTTVHGPVIGYATVGGTKVAISHQRSTYGRELASALAFADLDRNKVTSAKSFFSVMNQEEFSFNWVYADNKDIAFFSAARLPKRAPGVDIGLPANGTGQYDWQGVEPLSAHARGMNPPSGYILGWNNRPAKGYSAPDDQWSWGSVQRVQLLQAALARYKKQNVASTVGAMNQAATQDLRVVLVWPTIDDFLARRPAPNARDAQMVAILNAWRGRGGSRLDGDLDGKVDDPGAAIMDAAWPKLADAVLRAPLGPLTDRLAELIPRDDNANDQGSSFNSGWYGYVKDDLSNASDYPLLLRARRARANARSDRGMSRPSVGGDRRGRRPARKPRRARIRPPGGPTRTPSGSASCPACSARRCAGRTAPRSSKSSRSRAIVPAS